MQPHLLAVVIGACLALAPGCEDQDRRAPEASLATSATVLDSHQKDIKKSELCRREKCKCRAALKDCLDKVQACPGPSFPPVAPDPECVFELPTSSSDRGLPFGDNKDASVCDEDHAKCRKALDACRERLETCIPPI